MGLILSQFLVTLNQIFHPIYHQNEIGVLVNQFTANF